MKRYCAWCAKPGHDRRNCPTTPKRRSKLFATRNEDYRANRTAGLCDECGAKSKRRARCRRCADRRNARPSRRPAYRRKHERGYGATS